MKPTDEERQHLSQQSPICISLEQLFAMRDDNTGDQFLNDTDAMVIALNLVHLAMLPADTEAAPLPHKSGYAGRSKRSGFPVQPA